MMFEAQRSITSRMPCVPLFSQYVLNDKVSYPEETFMDWEFKISVMYDIAKVRQKRWSLNADFCFVFLLKDKFKQKWKIFFSFT